MRWCERKAFVGGSGQLFVVYATEGLGPGAKGPGEMVK
jgi:hypothetical protein